MNGNKFESELCEILHASGYWALNIPKNKYGAQPFDVIAMKGAYVFVTDCKVCATHLFPLERVEDNQWLAFSMIGERTEAHAGLTIYFKGDIYWVDFSEIAEAMKYGDSSIELYGRHPMWRREDIKKLIGRYID